MRRVALFYITTNLLNSELNITAEFSYLLCGQCVAFEKLQSQGNESAEGKCCLSAAMKTVTTLWTP